MKKHRDTTLSRQYFTALVERYEIKGVAKIIKKTSQQVWRLKFGWRGSLPSPDVIRNLAEHFNEPAKTIERKIFGGTEAAPEVRHPNIRRAVSENAFFHDQFESIFFCREFTKEEEDLITFFYLVKSGEKLIYENHLFEVLTPEKKSEALSQCEKEKNLTMEFQQVIGSWFKRKERYFFKNNTSKSNGIIFLHSFRELLEAETERRAFQGRLESLASGLNEGSIF